VLRSDWTGPISARVAWLVFLQVERQLLPPTENRWLIKSLLSQWVLHTDRACPVTPALGHSMGPLTMGNKYGPTEILEVLFNVQTVYGDTRYRPSPWLRRRGALGLSLMHIES
jgi:hypothetical protein